ncbi:methyltransferase [Flavobacterium suaedae]|uniref:Methyltransferase n=1 Tax=Flavobacterium suaedae TaxID=1767027 RepID=A0ABQ1K371_9FLAO|nr:class I SAM-dependent methyltransferase [Flavobacterium suaedae]GGB86184.1 methyltransferase [Flavobacterium suaedae]
MKDNFSIQAKGYSQYRPHYPQEMVDCILSHTKSLDTALDVATGNGQVAVMLSGYFKDVHAIDISSNQLQNATQKTNITYTEQKAEATNFKDSFFDLITVAQAIHWFNFDVFYKEVYRLLKPDGIIAVMGYGLFKTNSATDRIISRFYHDILGPYWDGERNYIEENYKTIPFPFEEIYPEKQFFNEFTWSFKQLKGYLETWSAVQHYIKENGSNPFDLIEESLKETWQKSDKRVTFPLLLRIGKM